MKPERSVTTSTASATLSTIVSFVLVDLVVTTDGSLADGDKSEIDGVLVVGEGFLEGGTDTGWAGPILYYFIQFVCHASRRTKYTKIFVRVTGHRGHLRICETSHEMGEK
jgi:hypothetical protein